MSRKFIELEKKIELGVPIEKIIRLPKGKLHLPVSKLENK